ncbi:hypothetical protein [Glycomyces sp. MUSA5-2]|uniref:hypothetical protein n=1 Tax=Glycomyces sp. MUSA5-2 TaxID=2053002 RepID=UPI00300B7E7C
MDGTYTDTCTECGFYFEPSGRCYCCILCYRPYDDHTADELAACNEHCAWLYADED